MRHHRRYHWRCQDCGTWGDAIAPLAVDQAAIHVKTTGHTVANWPRGNRDRLEYMKPFGPCDPDSGRYPYVKRTRRG
jgi:hypothetical protein